MTPKGEDLFAVIEIGTTSIRMAVAETDKQGGFKMLDTLQRAVLLGRDTFTKGCIEQETIEECVKGLRDYQRILHEYGLTDQAKVVAVATSAIRESINRDEVLDRIFVATGLSVEILEDAEISRYTYLAVHKYLKKAELAGGSNLLIMEVGGGSTDSLTLRQGSVGNAQVFKIGSYRIRRSLEDYNVPESRLRHVMKTQIERAVDGIKMGIGKIGHPVLLVLGGDARFAAGAIVPGWDKTTIVKLAVTDLEKLTGEISRLQPDDIVKKYHLSYPDAETVGPALMVYVQLAERLGVKDIHVSSATIRDGIIHEMVTHESWTKEFRGQIISSALEIGRKYHMEHNHVRFVSTLCRKIFFALQKEHHLDPRHELILNLAAILHDTGHFISNRSHHKHSMYLIMNSDIFGLGPRDIMLVALVARYHRKAIPRMEHEFYGTLDRKSRIIVTKLAAILRIADTLDSARSLHGLGMDVKVEDDRLIIGVNTDRDLVLEKHALEEECQMFERVYGVKVLLTRGRGTEDEPVGKSE
ncbi:MAG: HD domain-containing protein [Kiritimatiellae bacterium]|nr:HD domain-containing protein [Kiritimatiellia bacterium]MDD5521631.1 HD domain-containing protein [Kiritimatiellia bacterium]